MIPQSSVEIFIEIFISAVPDSEDITDVSLVKQKAIAVLAEKSFFFIDTEVQGGVHRCWGGTHGRSGALHPVGISELKIVVAHDDVEGFHDCLVVWCQGEEISDDRHGMIGVNVGIH